jgi:hypothetical protein
MSRRKRWGLGLTVFAVVLLIGNRHRIFTPAQDIIGNGTEYDVAVVFRPSLPRGYEFEASKAFRAEYGRIPTASGFERIDSATGKDGFVNAFICRNCEKKARAFYGQPRFASTVLCILGPTRWEDMYTVRCPGEAPLPES